MTVNSTRLVSICDRVINWSIYASLALVPIIFAFWQENFNIFELNKLLVFKSALVLAWLALLVKITITKQLKLSFDPKILLVLLVLFVYIIANTFLALDPEQSFFGIYMRQQGILSLIYYWLYFLLLLFHLRPDQSLRPYLLAVAIGLLPVLTYAFAQKLGFDPLRWTEPGTGRTFANLGQPNFLAYYLDLTIFLLLASWSWLSKTWHKLFLLFITALQLVVLSFTTSRGGLIGLIAGALVLLAAKLWRLGHKKTLFISLSSIIALVIASHFFVHTLVTRNIITNPVLIHYASSFSSPSGSSQVRLFYWHSAWQDFEASSWSRRLLGYGKDGQRSVFVRYYQPTWGLHEKLNSYPDRAHNLIIDIYLEFGLIGLSLFAWLSLLVASRSLKFWYTSSAPIAKLIPYLLAALAAYFASNLFGFPLTTHYLYYYFILALLWLISTSASERIIKLPFSSLFCWLTIAGLTAFQVFFLWQFTYKYFIADTYFMKAKVAEARLDCAGVITNLSQTIAWQPLDLYYQEKFIFMSNNCLPLIDQSSRKQVLRALLEQLSKLRERPYDYDLTLNIARSYSLFAYYFDPKYYAEAEGYYQQLIQLNPDILSAYQDYGRMKIWAGDYETAKSIFRQGIARSPMQISNYQDFGYTDLINSQTYYLWQLIATCDYNQKHFKEALAVYLDIESKNLVSVELYKNIADSYYQLKNYAQTELYLQKALALVPTDANINAGLASFYAERGDLAKAKSFAEAALLINPDHREAREIIAKLKLIK